MGGGGFTATLGEGNNYDGRVYTATSAPLSIWCGHVLITRRQDAGFPDGRPRSPPDAVMTSRRRAPCAARNGRRRLRGIPIRDIELNRGEDALA